MLKGFNTIATDANLTNWKISIHNWPTTSNTLAVNTHFQLSSDIPFQ